MLSDKKIIVSMTSYKKRICNLGKSVFALLCKQILPPDEIYIWLSEEEFPNKEKDLPSDAQDIAYNEKVHIMWLKENTRVHKRHEIFKILKEDSYVFFIDDDVFYNKTLIRNAINASKSLNDTAIINYNPYENHGYKGTHILRLQAKARRKEINVQRWCGQSMIPSHLYPKEVLSDEMQALRNLVSPYSDECWIWPWVVYYDIPIYSLTEGWGTDITKDTGKASGLTSWRYRINEHGKINQDEWLEDVLNAVPKLKEKFKKVFGYGK